MSVEENKAIVKRLLEDGIGKNDPAVLDELFAPDIALIAGDTVIMRGIDENKQSVNALHNHYVDFKDVIEEMIAEGDKVMVRVTRTGAHKGPINSPIVGLIAPTGKKVAYGTVLIYRLAGGKIVETRLYSDQAMLLQQLGVLAARTGP